MTIPTFSDSSTPQPTPLQSPLCQPQIARSAIESGGGYAALPPTLPAAPPAPSPTVAAVSIKLPLFWPTNPLYGFCKWRPSLIFSYYLTTDPF